MNLVVLLLVGGLIGWVASVLMKTNGRQGLVLNVVVGIVGAWLGGMLLGRFFATATINEGDFTFSGLIVSLVGAVTLLWLLKLFRPAG